MNSLTPTLASLIFGLRGKISPKEYKIIKRHLDSHNKKSKPKPKPVVKYKLLDSITESNDKKKLIFNFKNDASFTYNLINKSFNLTGSLSTVEFISPVLPKTLNSERELFITSAKEPWIQTFFKICRHCDISLLKSRGAGKATLNRIEIISKIEKFQNLSSYDGIDKLVRNSKFKTSLKDLGLDSWFIDAALKDGNLWHHISEYQNAKKSNLISEFQFLWNNYNYTNICRLYKKLGRLIKDHDYDFIKTIDYLNEGMNNHGIKYKDDSPYYNCDDNYKVAIDLLLDYVKFQTDKNFEKYPRNLKTEVDKAFYRKKLIESKALYEASKENFQKLKALEFEDENYCIIAPQSIEDIVKEGSVLNHCVANYARKVASGRSRILFMRKITNKNIPFITISLSGNKIEMARRKNNNLVYDSSVEKTFLNKYTNHLKSLSKN
jgi:hypothetical protein